MLKNILQRVPVVPVLTVRDLDHAVPLAEALVAGGLDVLEVTLRTDVALKAIRRIAEEVPNAVVGAGTVVSPEDLEAAEAGAKFAVSPGLPAALARAAQYSEATPLLPGVATPTEAMNAYDQGFSFLKLFPAEVVGGRAMLKAINGPLPQLSFCPTGGVGPSTFRDYLALPNVICVGGSWVAPRDAMEQGDWSRITELAREACRDDASEDTAS